MPEHKDQMHLIPKVNFAVVGVQKGGTTALRHFLSQHPEIGLSKEGEAHFFDRTFDPNQPRDDRKYHAMFDPENLERVTGDFTPIYMYIKDIPSQIRAYNPDMKIIAVLRDPVHRAYSQWVMQKEKREQRDGFLMTILKEPIRYMILGQHAVFSHVQRGFYFGQIRRIKAIFPAEQCLFLRNEDLARNHDKTMRQVYRFLQIAEVEPPAQKIVHKRDYDPIPRLPELLLRLIYWRDIRKLEYLLDWDCSAWRRF